MYDFVQIIHGRFMDDLWMVYGGFMEDLWRVHGWSMDKFPLENDGDVTLPISEVVLKAQPGQRRIFLAAMRSGDEIWEPPAMMIIVDLTCDYIV